MDCSIDFYTVFVKNAPSKMNNHGQHGIANGPPKRAKVMLALDMDPSVSLLCLTEPQSDPPGARNGPGATRALLGACF